MVLELPFNLESFRAWSTDVEIQHPCLREHSKVKNCIMSVAWPALFPSTNNVDRPWNTMEKSSVKMVDGREASLERLIRSRRQLPWFAIHTKRCGPDTRPSTKSDELMGRPEVLKDRSLSRSRTACMRLASFLV